ncbi:MAG: type II secretion system protein GspM [Lysobacterales bacterium]
MALTLLPAPGKGKPVAIGLALAALLIVYFLVFHGFITQHVAYAEELSDLKDSELRFRQIAAQRPEIEKRLAEVRQFQAGANYFLPEDSFDLAAANLNTKLKQIIADKAKDQQRCQLVSSQNERPTSPEPYQRVVVKVRMRCDLDDMVEILYELENATPFLFVTDLNLYQQLMFQGGMPQPNLGDMDVRFDVSGYIRSAGGQP